MEGRQEMSGGSRETRKSAPRAGHLEIAQQILNDARARGLDPGTHLPEMVYARLCNVSRTPVRAALNLLVDQGLATHAAGGGFRLASGFAATSVFAEPLPSAAEAELAGRILRDRAARRLDEAVTVGELIRRYGAARSAVVKALIKLAEDGFVNRAPGQSWVFAPLPDAPESLADSYAFRLLLEPEALGTPGFRHDPDRAAALRHAMVAFLAEPDERLDPRAFQTLDVEFHGLIARGAANRFVTDALLVHLRLRESPGAAARTNVVRLRQAMLEHLGILDQIEAGRFDVAADLLRVHLRLSRSQRPQVANRGAPPLFGQPFRTGKGHA